MSQKEVDRLEIMGKIASKQSTQAQAAELLGLSRRQVGRLYQKYKEKGAQGLISQRRGKASNNKLSAELTEQVVSLIRAHYPDFGPTLAHEKLTEEHKLRLSVESCRQIMMRNGIWKGKKRKRAQVHQMRARRASYGELVQIDGSPHAWFEDRAERCTLLVFVDDATGKIMQLYFEKEESTAGYMEAIRRYLLAHGRPLAYYSDRHSIFRVNAKEAKRGTGETQLSRALRELDIELINANSPQAKGRVERMNASLQDRLVKEMRLKGVSSIEEANEFMPEFIEQYNKRFSVEAASPNDAHRKTIPDHQELELILSQRHERTISKNLEIHYHNKIYQIQVADVGYTMRHANALIYDRNGKITIRYKGSTLTYKVFEKNHRPTPVLSSKQVNAHVDNKKKRKPAPNHPWKRTPVTTNYQQSA